jgi:NAD(P)-dependent dehydrogenase (short-subunit alcohol dehydrogenase family)
MDLKGKVALVTGAGSGIGRETALELARRGSTCVLVDVSGEKLADVLSAVRAFSAKSVAEVCDVGDRGRVDEMVSTVVDRFGGVDILINNAGVMIVKFFGSLSEEEFETMMASNFYGAVNLMRAVIPIMERAGKGTIINVASVGGRLVVPGTGVYAASKSALHAFSESLHYELKDKGIHVGIVVPGGTATGIFDTATTKLGGYYRSQSTAPPSVIARSIRKSIENERFIAVAPFRYKLMMGFHDAFPGLFSRTLMGRLRPYFE